MAVSGVCCRGCIVSARWRHRRLRCPQTTVGQGRHAPRYLEPAARFCMQYRSQPSYMWSRDHRSARDARRRYTCSSFRICSPRRTYSAKHSGLRRVAGLMDSTGAPLMSLRMGTAVSLLMRVHSDGIRNLHSLVVRLIQHPLHVHQTASAQHTTLTFDPLPRQCDGNITDPLNPPRHMPR